ncbi:hypothetical protein WDZ17_07410 [Pseudokineococcus basanitobsidens]|uniref:Uncharacterized protein n=1 Tax=Pseudokineococcus basanitobsidens TaxID=1926649 RepID=A0ABU8RJH3_9ACTN
MSGRGTGGEEPVDVDAAWAEIVARWEDPTGARPARERGPTPDDPAAGRSRAPGPPAEQPPGTEPSGTEPPATEPPRTDGPPPPAAPGPGAERPGPPAGPPAPRPDGRGTGTPRGWADGDADGPAGAWRPGAVPDAGRPDEEEHYVPPPPAPAPPVGGLVRAAWVGALGGPALLLVCALVWRGAPTPVVVAAVVAFVAGFAVLVSRLPRSRDDGDDDGAVV